MNAAATCASVFPRDLAHDLAEVGRIGDFLPPMTLGNMRETQLIKKVPPDIRTKPGSVSDLCLGGRSKRQNNIMALTARSRKGHRCVLITSEGLSQPSSKVQR